VEIVGSNTTINGNAPMLQDGVIDILNNADVTIRGLTIAGGLRQVSGGGIRKQNGRLTLVNSTVTANSVPSPAAFGGGGIFNGPGDMLILSSTVSLNAAPKGGGIWNIGTLTLTNSTLYSNHATAGSGGGINNAGTLAVSKSQVTANDAFYSGGGIANFNVLNVTRTSFAGNRADSDADSVGNGGGIHNGGTLLLDHSLVLINSAVWGGGINNEDLAIATILFTSIYSNSVIGAGGGLSNQLDATASLVNSTLSANSASASGGGIYNDPNGGLVTRTVVNLSNVTIAENTADSNANNTGNGGGIGNLATLIARNSIIANNHDLSPSAGVAPDCAVSLTSAGYNLIGNPAGCAFTANHDLSNQNPLLGPLTYYGSFAVTHALLAGSPAIEAGNPGGCTDHNAILLTRDQRDRWRPADGDGNGSFICDMGAFEYGALTPRSLWLPLVVR
jgi:hypothetical protein